MKDFPVLKVLSKRNSPIGDDVEVWLDGVKLENVTRLTIQAAPGNINRAFLTTEVALDIEVGADVKDITL